MDNSTERYSAFVWPTMAYSQKASKYKLGMFIQSCACSYETTAFNDQMNLKSGPHGLWQFMPDSYPTDNYTNPTIGCNTVPKDS